jgi:hypothetical protein
MPYKLLAGSPEYCYGLADNCLLYVDACVAQGLILDKTAG